MSRGNRTARRLRLSLALLGPVVLLLVGFTGWQALQVKTELEKVAQDFDALGGQLSSGDQAAAPVHAGRRPGRTPAPRCGTPGARRGGSPRGSRGSGPTSRRSAPSRVTTQRLADGVLPDVVATAGTLSPDSLRPVDGRIDLAPIAASEPAVVRAASRLADRVRPGPADRPGAAGAADRRPGGGAADTHRRRRGPGRPRLARRPAAAADAGRPAAAAPTCSCSRTTRRSAPPGGIPGAFATITADRGRLTLGRQDDASDDRRLPSAPDAADRPGAGRVRSRARALPAGRELHPGLPALGAADRRDVPRAPTGARSTASSRSTPSRCPTCCAAPGRSAPAVAS